MIFFISSPPDSAGGRENPVGPFSFHCRLTIPFRNHDFLEILFRLVFFLVSNGSSSPFLSGSVPARFRIPRALVMSAFAARARKNSSVSAEIFSATANESGISIRIFSGFWCLRIYLFDFPSQPLALFHINLLRKPLRLLWLNVSCRRSFGRA